MSIKMISFALLVLISMVVERGEGGKTAGGKGGLSAGSRRRALSSQRRRTYSKAAILNTANWTDRDYNYQQYESSSYKRFAVPELCVQCNASYNNETCLANNTVCYQSSDCYSLQFTRDGNTSLLSKGCLYNVTGQSGCDELVTDCERLYSNCSCSYCETGYCNGPTKAYDKSTLLLASLGVVLTLGLLLSFLSF